MQNLALLTPKREGLRPKSPVAPHQGAMARSCGRPGGPYSPTLKGAVRPSSGSRSTGPVGPTVTLTFFARWWWWLWCRRARPVARRVLCAAPDAALHVPCGVPVVVPLARFAAPDAAQCQTSPCLQVETLVWRVR